MTLTERKQATHEAITNPQVGDRFSEMFAFWLYVIALAGDTVVTMEASGKPTFPKDGKVKIQTRDEFQRRLSYGGGTPGYWALLVDRGNDVRGWWRVAT